MNTPTEFSSILNQLIHHQKSLTDHTAFIEDDRIRTWGESVERIFKITQGLKSLGIGKGDRVAMLAKNSIEYSETMLACLAMGACMVPLGTMITAKTMELMLKDSGSKALFISKDFQNIAEAFIDSFKQIDAAARFAYDFDDGNWHNFEAWLQNFSAEAPEDNLNLDDEFNIIYSSGTTGVPKGILHHHKARHQLAVSFTGSKDDINLISTPLYSNTTITTWYPAAYHGSTNVIMPKFDAREALVLIEKHKVTGAMFVPVQYDRMLRVEDFDQFDLSSMKMKFSTSAPLRAQLKRNLLDRFPGMLVEFYGLTEGGVGTVLICDLYPDKLDSVGQCGPGQELKILDENGKELPVGKTGEIVGRAIIMSEGYINREDANNEMFWHDADGQLFYKSGDIGRLDEDGFLYLLDRKKDMIISGGLNIFATDLEIELLKHPAVHEVAVIAIPSDAWGETPLALVVKEPSVEVNAEEILSATNANLAKSQRISFLEFRDELPKSEIGKVLKRELRDEHLAAQNTRS